MKKKLVKRKKVQFGTITNPNRPRQADPNYNWMDFDETAFPSIPGAVNPINQMPITAQGTDTGETANNIPLRSNPDGSYSFQRTEGTGVMQDNPFVTGFNALATGVTGLANTIQNNRLKKREQMQMIEANQPKYWENMEGAGLNNIPMYTQYGGKTSRKYRAGGHEPSVAKAKEMLRDGTVNGKPLTEKQKGYFGWIVGGKKQMGGKVYENQAQIDAANIEAQRLATSQGLMIGSTATIGRNIGDPIIPYIDTATGKEYVPVPTKPLATTLPRNVSVGDIQSSQGVYWYVDPETGDPVDVNPEVIFGKYKKPKLPIPQNQIARVNIKKQVGGGTSVYNTRAEIDVANLEAKRLAKAKGLMNPQESYAARDVGDPVVQYVNPDGTPYVPMSTKPKATYIPEGVDLQSGQGQFWYDDPQTGDPVDVDYSVANLPRFRKTPEEALALKVEREFAQRKLGIPNRQPTGSLNYQAGGVPEGYHVMHDGSLMPDGEMETGKVEAEQGEIVEGSDGRIVKISDTAKRHEQGGVKLNNVSRVLEDTSDKRKDRASKMLKLSPEEMESLFGFKPKSSVSHSKAFELANKHYDSKRDKINRNNKLINDRTKVDKYGAKSAELNFKTLQDIPTQEDVYDALFMHQESVKGMNDIDDDGSMKHGGKYKKRSGKYNVRGRRAAHHKAQAGAGVTPYQGGRTPSGRTTPTGNPNQFNFPGGLDAYKSAWSPVLDLSQYNDVSQAQQATYNYLVQNQPDVAASIWQTQGLTQKGRDMMNPKSRSYDQGFARIAANIFDSTGKLKQGVNLTPEQLQALTPAYSDDMLGVRAVTPSQTTQTTGQVLPGSTQPPAAASGQPLDSSVTVNPNFIRQPANQFREGMYWDELAAPLMGLTEGRDAELYNPVQLNQLRYKLLDPTAALNANQADFNAVAEGLDPANTANLLANKYAANAQVLANYDNQNTQIKNREIDYNTGVRDRQSVADASTRAVYDRSVKTSREVQRQQRLKAIEDISRAIQMKRRQNKSGNLILKMSPAFDQSGEYNGYQYAPILPTDLGINSELPVVTPPKKTSSTKTTTTWKIGDRTIKTENRQ